MVCHPATRMMKWRLTITSAWPRLIAVNAISLTVALIANLALLMNMGRRLPYSIAQPITIIGWYMASLLLIALVIAAPARIHNGTPENDALTQAFYYAVMAAVLYFIVASMMVFSVLGAHRGHYSKEFKLTTSQRTLMLQTILFLAYILLGGLVYSHIEKWKYLDAVYWADVTLLTIGLGDFTPSTHLGRALMFPFAVGGIVFVGLVIGSIRSLLLERVKEKLGYRMVEKTRQNALKSLNPRKGTIKVTLFSKSNLRTGASSTQDRARAEFEVMRAIQDQAARKRRWTALITSAGASLVLWLVGAAVFQQAERSQGWTYFQSVYFAFVVLLTIGYGDYRPQGNASRAFFVCWSLLAIPTLTILISNIGSTVATTIRDATIRVGEWTVLPGETSVGDLLRHGMSKPTKKPKGPQSDMEKSAGEFPAGVSGEANGGKDGQAAPKADGLAEVAGTMEGEEQGKAEAAGRRGDRSAEDKHRHQQLLLKEIRKVMPHLNQNPPPKYTYEEWTRFLRLIGQQVIPWTEVAKRQDEEDSKQSSDGSQEKRQPWSWLSEESALMSNKSEPEWVLEHLARTLESLFEKPRS